MAGNNGGMGDGIGGKGVTMQDSKLGSQGNHMMDSGSAKTAQANAKADEANAKAEAAGTAMSGAMNDKFNESGLAAKVPDQGAMEADMQNKLDEKQKLLESKVDPKLKGKVSKWMARANAFADKQRQRKADLEAKFNDMHDELEAKVEAKRTELEAEKQAKIDEMEAKLRSQDLPPEMKKKLEREKLEMEANYKKKEEALDHLGDEENDYYMDPDDDPLLLHVEVLDGEAEGDDEEGQRDHDDIFQHNARLLINKIYLRQNTYLESSQYCDSQDFKLFLPITIFTLFASIIGFLASSPLMKDHPRLMSAVGGILGLAAVELGTIRNKAKMNARAEQFRSAALQYRMLATQLEEKLFTYLKLPEHSKERDAAATEWKEYFHDVSTKIRAVQTETNMPPLEKKVKQWMVDGTVAPNVIDQPCQPPRELTMDEKLEAACVRKLDRAGAKHAELDAELQELGLEKQEPINKKKKKKKKAN